jgi:hypothetical protein
VVDLQNRVLKITEFSQLLGQPVTTMKRLFTNEVLNPRLVKKTGGGHWLVCFSPADLLRCRASIALWKVLRRKPRLARTYKVRDLLHSLAIDLVLSEEISSQRQSCRSPLKKLQATKRALDLLRTRPENVESIWWYQQMLKFPEAFAGTFILRVEVERFRSMYDRSPKRSELAETLNISESSLYRLPFGPKALTRAYEGWRPEEVEDDGSATDDRTESYISESEQELSREERNSQLRRTLAHGFREVKARRRIGEEILRKVRQKKRSCLNLAWEEVHIPNHPGEMLLLVPTRSIERKRLLEQIELQQNRNDASDSRRVVKRQSRKLRSALELRQRDETFQSWAVGAYEIQRDGKCRWWMNSVDARGCADSPAQARHEILSAVGERRTRFPIVNLAEMLAECGVEA